MKVISFKFTAKDIKQTDVTRFRNLFQKLGVKCKCIDSPTNLKGQKHYVLYDEVDSIDVEKVMKLKYKPFIKKGKGKITLITTLIQKEKTSRKQKL